MPWGSPDRQDARDWLGQCRVLDLTDERGLLAGHLLAQLGADVVQVEPPGGSPGRIVPPFDATPGGNGTSLFWSAYAAGKRGVTLALDTAAGRETLLDLVRKADILIESAAPGQMAALGLNYAQLRPTNPRLIHVSITAFGSTGPKAAYAASDLAIWAAAGTLWPHRDQHGVPLRISVPQAFHQAAIDAVGGALIALLAREDSGKGQHVDVSAQASCTLCTLSSHLAMAVSHADFNALGGVQNSKLLDLSGSGARTRKTKWQVADGLVEMHIGMGTAAGRHANALFAWLNELGTCPPEFAGWDWVAIPERLMSGELTGDDLNRARAYVGEALAPFTKAQILAIAQEKGLLMAPILTTADLLASPQFAARGLFAAVTGGADAKVLPRPFAPGCGMSGIPLAPAPDLGEHNGEILGNPTGRSPDPAGDEPPEPALAGLKVLDLAWVVAGPLVGRALADFGATVVRVESRKRVDTARVMGPFPHARFDNQQSLLFENSNAGKLGIALDLTTQDAREVVRDLVGWADMVIESFMPGQMARFGLDYARLKEINPGIIMLSSSLMGQSGPNAGLAGFGNIGGALSGFQNLVGQPGELPVGTYGPYTDYVAPRFALMALLSAIGRRRQTGEGCHLDISQVEAAVTLLAPQLLDCQINGRIAEPLGNRGEAEAPSGIFPARGEDRWVAIVARDDADWQRLARMVGGKDLAADPRFGTLAGRKRHEDEIEEHLAAWTRQYDAERIEEMLQKRNIPAHVVAASEDIITDAQLLARDHIIHLPHPLMGETVFDAARYRLTETPARYERPAPWFGRDTAHILGTILGYDQHRIETLAAAGALQ